MKKKVKILVSILALLLFMAALALTAHAKGYTNIYPVTENANIKKLITAEPLTMRDDEDAVGITALYSVDTKALAKLEETYYVSFGTLVARESDGYDLTNLRLEYDEEKGKVTAPYHTSMLTVYSTGGKHTVNGKFLTEKRDSFSVTLDIGTPTVERASDGTVHLAFIILEPKVGERTPELYYVCRKATSYGLYVPSFEGMVQAEYKENKGDEEAVDAYIDFLQNQIKTDVSALSDAPVVICGDGGMAATLEDGERAIWVEYLPDKDPYPNGTTVKRNVRAAYIYYPLEFDPSYENASDLAKMGVKRVFAYIATPPYAEDAPGLVCVHGGGGHAYAEYALEAAMNGYAAIAIDTEGYYNTTGGKDTPYSAGTSAYAPDSLGHLEKDNFENAEGSLSKQWLYYAVMDTVLANTVLRSMEEVDENAVGITGISWGGLITSTALCYDHRYAFASPVYISFHMAESYGTSVGGLKNEEKAFAAALWQDVKLFKKCPVPTLIISCENDLFASIDTVSKSANDLPNGTLLIKPRLLHGQQYAASLPEIYEFGYTVLGRSKGFITTKTELPDRKEAVDSLKLDVPEGASDVSAKLYYLETLLSSYGKREDVNFKEVELTVNSDYTVDVVVPEDARMYFVAFSYYDKAVYDRQKGTPYLASDKYAQGYIYSSTDLVYVR